jgi:membrane protein implicated in regulation of membrane protease activity
MDGLLTLLGNAPYWGWFALAVAFLIAEITTGTTYILWPAVAAAAVGVLTLAGLGLGVQAQWVVFALATIVLTLIGHRFVRPRLMASKDPELNDRRLQLIGSKGVAASAFAGPTGRMKLGDTEWRAELVQGVAEAGTPLEVVGVDGATLKVRPAVSEAR